MTDVKGGLAALPRFSSEKLWPANENMEEHRQKSTSLGFLGLLMFAVSYFLVGSNKKVVQWDCLLDFEAFILA